MRRTAMSSSWSLSAVRFLTLSYKAFRSERSCLTCTLLKFPTLLTCGIQASLQGKSSAKCACLCTLQAMSLVDRWTSAACTGMQDGHAR